MSFKDNINTWIFDLDNTLYSADSGIFQQVHKLMGEFVAKNLNMELAEAKKLQAKYYKQHGTTLRGMMDNHGVDPDYFLEEVHKLDYSIVGPNQNLNDELYKLEGRKIIYTNANKQHVLDVLEKINLTNFFDEYMILKWLIIFLSQKFLPMKKLSTYLISKQINPQCLMILQRI